jgi:protein arginine N-methyltransferase 5
MAEHSATLGAVLDIGRTLPPPHHWRRWLGEPLKAVVLHTDAFLSNKRGFPVLPKAHQDLIAVLCAHGIQLVLSGPLLHQAAAVEAARAAGAGEAGNGGGDVAVKRHHELTVYWEYLAYLYSKMPAMGDHERLEASYRDYLQAPLQPLADNLESQVYEVFEKDGTKYSQYEHAVAAALRHVVATRGEARGKVVLMVVGAGRGPLVRAALRACDTVGLSAPDGYSLYAVEKNPNAMVHLSALWHSLPQWQAAVQLVGHDMRTWEAPAAADIMVSELLGSFGDNELSPECLDGAQRFLAPGGISIPQSYTSYLVPVTAAKLWNDIRAHNDVAHLETPYVVNLHRCAPLADILECFTFEHPNQQQPIDNSRTARLHFSRPADAPGALCHGFAGYFHSILYGDVTLSIHPEMHTPNMFSWFPIFFPLRAPVPVPAGRGVTVHMWRRGTQTKVWYEWALESPGEGSVHNLNGRSYHVGL